MIDLIILVMLGATFYGGFKCGNKFATLRAMASAAKAWVAKA